LAHSSRGLGHLPLKYVSHKLLLAAVLLIGIGIGLGTGYKSVARRQ